MEAIYERTLSDLIELIEHFDSDRRSANVAVAIIENRAVPEAMEEDVRARLCCFIEATMPSQAPADQICLRCAMRKYIFLQRRGYFVEIEWLLESIPPDQTFNRMEAVKTLVDFLRYDPPADIANAPNLTAFLVEQCMRFFDVESFHTSEHRVIAFQSLMALALLGDPATEGLVARARGVSDGVGKNLSSRAGNLIDSLSKRGVGSPEAHRLLRAMLA